MRFNIGDKVVNRHTNKSYIVVSISQGLVLQDDNGNVAQYCADVFTKQTLSRPDISGIKKSLRAYTR